MNEPTKLPDSGHLYTSRHYKGWKPKEGICRAAVADEGGWASWHQCSYKVKVTHPVHHRPSGKDIEVGYCNIHDPVKIAAKNAARSAKRKEESDTKSRERKLRINTTSALIKIAEGHNDPRALAIAVLAGEDI